MNVISWSELRKLSFAEAEKLLPITLTVEGIPTLAIDKIEDVLVLSDMHPAMQIKLKVLSARARMGMPPPKKVFANDVKEPIEG